MSILKIKDLVHKYVTYGDTEEDKQEIAAINHIDINVEKGEFVAILGKNGSGKSSLAKHINGLLMPTEGAVYIKGMDTKDESTLLNVRRYSLWSRESWSRTKRYLDKDYSSFDRRRNDGLQRSKSQSPLRRTEAKSSDRRNHGNGTRMYRIR